MLPTGGVIVHGIQRLVDDPSWRGLLEWHPAAAVFYSPEWLGAPWHTCGYKPRVLKTVRARHGQCEGCLSTAARWSLSGSDLIPAYVSVLF